MNLTDASIEMNFADVASDTATEGITDAAVEDAIDAAASAVEDVADAAAVFGGNCNTSKNRMGKFNHKLNHPFSL